MGAYFSITIPALPAGVTVNARSHWSARSTAAQAMRDEAHALARIEWGDRPPVDPPAVLEYAFGLPDRKRRDVDNLVSAAKSWLDGVVQAGVIADDDVRHIHAIRAVAVMAERGKPFTRISIIRYDN